MSRGSTEATLWKRCPIGRGRPGSHRYTPGPGRKTAGRGERATGRTSGTGGTGRQGPRGRGRVQAGRWAVGREHSACRARGPAVNTPLGRTAARIKRGGERRPIGAWPRGSHTSKTRGTTGQGSLKSSRTGRPTVRAAVAGLVAPALEAVTTLRLPAIGGSSSFSTAQRTILFKALRRPARLRRVGGAGPRALREPRRPAHA